MDGYVSKSRVEREYQDITFLHFCMEKFSKVSD